jgi:hypothetical protein
MMVEDENMHGYRHGFELAEYGVCIELGVLWSER